MVAGERGTTGMVDIRRAIALNPFVLALRVCLRASPGMTAGIVLLSIVFGIVPVAMYVAVSIFAGDVARDPSSPSIPILIPVIAVLFFGIQASSTPQYQLSVALGRRVDVWVRHGAMTAAMGPATVEHMESARFRAVADLARDWEAAPYPPSEAVHSLSEVIKAVVVAVGSAILLLELGWWVPIILSTGYVLMTIMGTRVRTSRSDDERTTAGLRRAQYLRDQAFEPASAREARLFGLTGWFRQASDRAWRTAMTDIWRGRAANRSVAIVTIVALLGSHVVVFACIMQATLDGRIGVTGAAIYLQGAGGLVNLWFPWHIIALREATRPFPAVEALIDEQAAAAEMEAVASTSRQPTTSLLEPNAPAVSIDIERVSYRYPGRDEPVFDGLDLQIVAGSSLAIVGANGAGKTTLVKLLCGLLDPDDGAVRVDGTDIRDVRPAWHARVGVIFQDFVRYPFTVTDNVVLGRPLGDLEPVTRALDRAGAAAMVEDLPEGLATVLSPDFDGVDLSGGQWQRLALARALYAVERGATVLVLDEPTAQLDVRAEAALFARFLELTAGLTTILISHRFSSVRHADRIVVLEGGRVVEDGSHESLLAASGRYATMFRTQASHFGDADAR